MRAELTYTTPSLNETTDWLRRQVELPGERVGHAGNLFAFVHLSVAWDGGFKFEGDVFVHDCQQR